MRILAAALVAAGAAACVAAGHLQGRAPASVEIRPAFVAVPAGRSVAFAISTGEPVEWSVAEGAPGGVIDADGLYVAPAGPGTFRVVATSPRDRTRSDVAVVGVSAPRGGVVPMPLVSRGVPARASSARSPATDAVDGDYRTQWRSDGEPRSGAAAWIALDLSGLPAERRRRVVLAWYADPANFNYDLSASGEAGKNLPAIYTIEGHRGPGGGEPPADPDPGWTVLARVDAPNALHSRQHVLDLERDGEPVAWLRMRVTAVRGSPGNEDVALNLDLHDAAAGVTDDWIFLGSSSTAHAMSHDPRAGACAAPCAWGHPGTFGELVERALPGSFPLQEAAGQAGLTAAEAARHLPRWLALFPGRFVALAYGANDARAVDPCDARCADAFEASYEEMIRAVVAAGKVPVVPTIPWAWQPEIRRNVPALNARIRALWAAHPEVVPGPDLWAIVEAHPELISSDGLHPTPLGALAYRNAWAEAMLASVYAR
jgi:lysophospholipase L1-like esterase